MMNGVSNYGMSVNSQVNFKSKNSSAKRTFDVVKTRQKYCNNAKMNNFVKELESKTEEIMERVKKGENTYNEALDAAMNLERSAQMQIKKFEAFV